MLQGSFSLSVFVSWLGLDQVPSEEALQQRLDGFGQFKPVLEEAAIAFLLRSEAPFTPLANSLMPLDCNVTPFDNAQTRKEGVSRTDKGMDGYAPMAVYLGQEGYCLEVELRVGSQHCQNGTPRFLQRVLVRHKMFKILGLYLM